MAGTGSVVPAEQGQNPWEEERKKIHFPFDFICSCITNLSARRKKKGDIWLFLYINIILYYIYI